MGIFKCSSWDLRSSPPVSDESFLSLLNEDKFQAAVHGAARAQENEPIISGLW